MPGQADDRQVEGEAGLDHAGRAGLLGGRLEVVERLAEAVEPLLGADRHAQPDGDLLDLLAQGHDLVDVVRGDRRDDGTLAGHLDDQALLLQDPHRLAQRRPADAELLGQPVLDHPVTGP